MTWVIYHTYHARRCFKSRNEKEIRNQSVRIVTRLPLECGTLGEEIPGEGTWGRRGKEGKRARGDREKGE